MIFLNFAGINLVRKNEEECSSGVQGKTQGKKKTGGTMTKSAQEGSADLKNHGLQFYNFQFYYLLYI